MDNRRTFLAAAGAVLAACAKKKDAEPDAEPSRLGKPLKAYGERASFEKAARLTPTTKQMENGSTRTPLAEQHGIITPSSLHFERHHSGVPEIDPARHTLTIHGMVDRPLVFTMDDLKRLPSVSRIHFIECSGNSGGEWGKKNAADVQRGFGLASCSEWTGVPLSLLLAEAGVQKGAKWLHAEGADACKMTRSIPIEKALKDILLAYGQNGEALRPEQGYPLRLMVPGWEGNVNVKWVHRIKLSDQPQYARDETSHYTDLMADGTARIFTFDMDAKSVITSPSGGQKIGSKGFYEIRGLAWSGRGRIEKVEVTLDGGKSWKPAQLDEVRHKQAFTRFRLPWTWDGTETTVASRATDDTGYVQPLVPDLVTVRGKNSQYHNNGIKFWQVTADGSVKNVEA